MTDGGAWLVVVADDAGIDAPRNRGILHAFREGLVTCTSILAAAPAFEDFAESARAAPELGVGLHLDLTEGTSLTGEIGGVTDAAGRFLGDKRELWRRALSGDVEPDAVQVEAEAQLARLVDAGLEPAHVDGHQHVHLLPGVREGLAAALGSFPGVRWVRAAPRIACPRDPGAWSSWPLLERDRLTEDGRTLDEIGLRAQAALASLAEEGGVLHGAGRRTADVFVGPDLIEDFRRERLLQRLRTAAELVCAGGCVVELMTHPGDRCNASVPFSASRQREVERDILSDPGVRDAVEALGFRLGSFADVLEAPA